MVSKNHSFVPLVPFFLSKLYSYDPGLACTLILRILITQDFTSFFGAVSEYHMPLFEELVSMAEESPLFARSSSGSTDVTGQEAAPLSLLILCALRCLGRGWTFDDLSENTGISAEVTRVLFHKFVEFGATVLYQKFVVAPLNAEGAAGHTAE